MHPRCKFGDRRSAGSRDTAHKYFVIALEPTIVGQGYLLFACNQGSLVGHYVKGVCVQWLRFVPPCLSKNWVVHLTTMTSRSMSNPRRLLHLCQVHPRCKVGDRRSASCRDNADTSILWWTKNWLDLRGLLLREGRERVKSRRVWGEWRGKEEE